MDEELKIRIEVVSVDTGSVAKQIQDQLNGIKGLKVNAGVNVDNLDEIKKQFQNINKDIGKQSFDGRQLSDPYKVASQELKKLYDLRKEYARIKNPTPLDTHNYTKEIELQQKALQQAMSKASTPENWDLGMERMLTMQREQAERELNSIEQTVTNKFQKIRDAVNVGDYEAKFAGLKAGFEKTGLSSEQAEEKIKSAKTAVDNFIKAFESGDRGQMTKAADEVSTSIRKVENELKVAKINAQDYSQVIDKPAHARLGNQIQKWLQQNTAATKDARNEMQRYLSEVENGGVTSTREKEIRARMGTLTNEQRALGRLGGSFFDTLRKDMGKFTQWVGASSVVMRVFNEIRKGIQTVKDLDAAMTNINYTMDVSSKQLNNVANSSVKMAKDLKTSTSNVLQAVTLYANANETAQSILEKSKPAIMLANVTGFSGEQSSKYLQTIMNQFDLTQDELLDISDTVQSVSQSIAHDFSDGIFQINDAVADSGEVARAAGMDLSKYSSIIGVLVENTGLQGSQLGNAMKSIITRTTKAGKILGIDEGDISNAEKALRDIGIEVRKTDGEFKEFDNTMSELAAKWDDLTDVEKSEVSFQLAGTRQTSILKSLVKNWEEVEEIAKKANESSGTTLENQEKYTQSLQGRMNELKATGESMWTNILNSGELKAGISLLSSLVKILDTITGKLHGLGTLGAGLGAWLGIRNAG